ncbi:homoprotocatechuate degradation operon regulator, HpaR [Burkholderiales bacterium JOSHI_001]|nr:homoprotocatechuate degradation operon regulator, HpaR [Burkholderiales bacterium JOSHI_001]
MNAAPKSPFRHRNLPLLLLRAREALMQQFRPFLTEQGLTDQQWRVVRALAEAHPQPLEPRQIGELCLISSPSLAGMLARMEGLGLVARQRMENDQRRVAVKLTPKARRIAVRVAEQAEGRYQALEAAIGVDLMHQVVDALDALAAGLQPAALDEAGEG